ncbi:tubby-like F-box protein 5 [Punica granatum]|uniref:Tubby-like F-box protein n=1 Tax=Punica granatum TaxID=22663 RepID=A0A6P8C664_PUNGR|nr:tubby-like F-box protein 5 [Punica granatum]
MPFKTFFREWKDHMKDGIRSTSKGRNSSAVEMSEHQMWDNPCEGSFPSSSSISSSQVFHQQSSSRWANLPPELLLDIISRLESAHRTWPARRDLVACASVCRSWRQATKEVTRTPERCGCLTFPASLKQPGPRETPIQCFIKRERATSTYRLYLGLTPALSGDMSKLLLAARKIRRAMSADFVISLVPDDFSRASSTYVGKLRSNFLGTKFTIYDSQPPTSNTVTIQSKSRMKTYWRSTNLKQVSPRLPVGNFNIATVSYELNVLRTRGPRRMRCTMHSIPVRTVQEQAGESSSAQTLPIDMPDASVPSLSRPNGKVIIDQSPELELAGGSRERDQSLVLKNKAPRWHEQLQCWCLNFKGRVTVASVKNFQLVAASEGGGIIPVSEQESVILQFGKIGKDIFTMDYRYPLSAFQAFAICLSSFDTKPACE